MTAIPGGAWNQETPEGPFSQDGKQQYGAFNQGLIEFSQIIGFFRRNLVRITIITAVLTAIALVLFSLYPFPYKATALVLVDPRERRVTLTENVLPGIGSDAAFLESIVQIVHSDGFLRPVLEDLDAKTDPFFARSVGPDDRELLAAFKRRLQVNRVGATFIVEISFSSNDPDKSALYANAVAQAFVDSQTDALVTANASAASSLEERLNDLRSNLEASEKAVASYKAENGIIGVTQDSTLLQRELITLNEQIVAAKAQTEAIRSSVEKISTGAGLPSTTEQSDAAQLAELRRERGQILQNLSEFGRVYGDRHPRVTSERSKLAGIDRQISLEQSRLLAIQKERLESANSTLQALTNELNQRKQTALRTERAMVQLASLEREATANRQLYEEFLARFKATEKQSGLELGQARIASPALPPLKPNRPGRVLAALVFLVLFGGCTTLYVFVREMAGVPVEKKPASQKAPKSLFDFRRRKQIGKKFREGRDRLSEPVGRLNETIQKMGFQEVPDRPIRAQRHARMRHHRLQTQSPALFDPKETAQYLKRGPLRRDVKTLQSRGAVVVVSSLEPNLDPSDAVLGIAALAGQRGLPVLLLTENQNLIDAHRKTPGALRLPETHSLSIVDPGEIAATHFRNRHSILEIVEGFSVSSAARDTCMIVDAPPVQNGKQVQRLSEFADLFVVVEDELEPDPMNDDILSGISSEVVQKLRWVSL
ncbi:GumC family protein [Roseibium sp.]|uniref:GumC family protein n=1 Tax=Roseibium sp. TaxID=1936156 RepID=UPI003D1210B2